MCCKNISKGHLQQKQYPSGTKSLYAYTAKGQLESLTHEDTTGILDRYQYTYDIQGNKTQIDKKRRGIDTESGIYKYGYDALQRLTEVTKDGNVLTGEKEIIYEELEIIPASIYNQ